MKILVKEINFLCMKKQCEVIGSNPLLDMIVITYM